MIRLALLLCCALAASAGARELECSGPAADAACTIDIVWTGVPVGFGAAASGDHLFVAYYDAARRVTVARIDVRRREIETTHLAAVFEGWDSHNSLVLALDAERRLHLAGNMHGDRLRYWRRGAPLSIADLAPAAMTGEHEERVTYPEFLRGANGDLLFLYRDGRAGDGVWRLNRLADGSWRPATGAPLFASAYAGAPVSAYFHKARGPDGQYHFAIVWRRSADAATNFRLSYLRTTDFAIWRDWPGRAVAPPIGPGDVEIVDDLPVGSGLLNNARIALDRGGRPAIVYTRYAADGRNAVHVARRAESGWVMRPIAVARGRSAIEGGGSLGAVPRFSPLRFAPQGGVSLTIAFPGEAPRELALDPETLAVLRERPPLASEVPVLDAPAGLAAPRLSTIRVATEACDKGQALLAWHTQGHNRDMPRACTPAEPLACAPPPSPLRLYLRCGGDALP